MVRDRCIGRVSLIGAGVSQPDLAGPNIIETDLMGAPLVSANMVRTKTPRCIVIGADFTRAVTRANL